MRISVYILILIALSAAACRSSVNRNRAAAQPESTIVIPSETGVVEMPLNDGQGKLAIRKEERKNVYIDFQSDGRTRLHAEVVPIGSPEGNLRINTIMLPDGTTDGPFGRTLDYDIPSSGTVRLEIGESLMQGDPWGGDFTVSILEAR